VTAADVQALKDALAAQQQQIEQLRQAMQSRDAALQQTQQQAQQAQQQLQQAQAATSEAQQKASSAESAANEQKESVTKLNSDLADVKTTLTNNAVSTQGVQKRVSALEGLVSRVRFNGDVRVRGEDFIQNGVPDRNRARLRVRFGFDGKLNEDFNSGIYLATGSLGDPTTTNETLTNFFDRKTVALERQVTEVTA
jgi:exonuclease VII large subunit